MPMTHAVPYKHVVNEQVSRLLHSRNQHQLSPFFICRRTNVHIVFFYAMAQLLLEV